MCKPRHIINRLIKSKDFVLRLGVIRHSLLIIKIKKNNKSLDLLKFATYVFITHLENFEYFSNGRKRVQKNCTFDIYQSLSIVFFIC